MIKQLYDTEAMTIFREAEKLVGLERIKEAFLNSFSAAPGISNGKKNAVRLAGEKLKDYPDSYPGMGDGVLMGILFLKWEDTGAIGMDPLTKQEREAIFSGVINTCRAIIDSEITRLEALRDMQYSLPQGWDVE